MKIRHILTCMALAVGMLIAMPGPATATAPPVAPAASSDAFEAEVIASTNQQRAARHKRQLRAQACIDQYAEAQAYWMSVNGKLQHQAMRPILKACKLKRVGENIAMGYSTGPLTVAAWMRSPGHKKNIVKSNYRLIGVGAYQDAYGRWWVSQVFGTRR